MSTHAIIGQKNDDGSVLGAWCWNDGAHLLTKLGEYVKTLAQAKELIELGQFGCICTPKEKRQMDIVAKAMAIPQEGRWERLSCGLWVHQDLHHIINSHPTLYPTFLEAWHEDAQYIYLFETANDQPGLACWARWK